MDPCQSPQETKSCRLPAFGRTGVCCLKPPRLWDFVMAAPGGLDRFPSTTQWVDAKDQTGICLLCLVASQHQR